LPLAHRKAKNVDLDIYKEHKKLVGTTDTNAKYRYVQLVRSLKSFGITFYNVAERVKGKKKPIPCSIGVTRDKIVKLDGETRVRWDFPLALFPDCLHSSIISGGC